MKKYILIMLLITLLASCNKEEPKKDIIDQKAKIEVQEIKTNSGEIKTEEKTSAGALEVKKEEVSINDGFTLLKNAKCGDFNYCSYKIVDGKIIYTKLDGSLEQINLEVSGADVETFKINRDLAKDKNYIYNREKILSGADVETFKYIGKLGGPGENYNYYGDKNSIYKIDFTSWTYKKVDGIDRDSFELISDNVSKDKNGVYIGFEFKKVDFKGDISSLNELSPNCPGIFKTNTSVYYDLLKELKGINSEYLKCIGSPDYGVVYYKDDKNYYCNDKVLPGLDYSSVEYVEVRKPTLGSYGYLKDKKVVYKDCELQKGVSPDSIKAN